MAGRKLIISREVAGSTIIEVLISMTVILLVFGIAITIYENVIGSSLSAAKINAEALLRERLLYIEQNPTSTAETGNPGIFRIEQEIKPYNANAHLEQVHLTALDPNNVQVAEIYKVILVP
jgi:Tfp pilus assembly protein PilE